MRMLIQWDTKILHVNCLPLNMIVAVLRVIGVHSEQITPGLSNMYGQAMLSAALPTAF
jgi:hypothetical protein